MKLTARSRTVVKQNHALITGDGFVNSTVPGWSGCTINVVINEAMGANFCQQLITMQADGVAKGQTIASELFFYIIEGSCKASVGNKQIDMTKGGFLYIPPQESYQISDAKQGTRLLSFQKAYENLEGTKAPALHFGNESEIPKAVYENDEQLLMQHLLPDTLSFDMAVNIFTYLPGGNLPFVETHVMEHGLIYLQGQGIYRLDDCWYPVTEGDCIWMAPYCPQWFVAMGKEPAVYIYYKNVNRHNISQ